ncbi:hypothetical protein Tco_0604457 [Tanacetum coccineum]
MSRWKDSNTPGKKVPKKVSCYFPDHSRQQRLYKLVTNCKGNEHWHATKESVRSQPRNVRLGLAADGFNPFGNLSQAYSMWPMILTTYNLPPWLCMKESSFMLTLLISGPKSPNKDVDVYLKPLIVDLKVLWALKVDCLGGVGKDYKGIPTCNEDNSISVVLDKTAYVGHIRFLKKPHKWRRSLEFNDEIEDGDPPRKFDWDQIQAQLARLPTRVKGKHPSYGDVKIKRNVLV